jgi:FSR family fosmidomycin resistance protein-like MFS transporter
MSQAILGESRVSHWRMVGVISAAHFVSHYYIIILAPLLPFVRAEYNVSYTEIGLAFAAFNIVTGALQTPAGFLVDWLGARIILIIGLIIGAAAFIVVGLVDSFWVMVAMFGLAGVGNTVYHPADYALLSHHVPSERIGQAFSIHTFAGMMGSAVAPASLLMMQSVWGWRGAFIGAGLAGFAIAAVLLMVPDNAPSQATTPAPRAGEDKPADGWKLLLSAPILMNLFFFVLIAMISGGMFNYSVVALGALYDTPVTVATNALSSLLLLSALGVLVGGVIATRISRHAYVAALGLAGMALTAALIAQFDLGTVSLIAVMTLFGFFYGVIMPSRDMIVREITPPGSFGKVFGFITTGFNIGGIVSPLIFGAVMDHGSPRLVFVAVAAFALLSVLTVITLPRKAS